MALIQPLEARVQSVAAGFEGYVRSLEESKPDWLPGESSAHGLAMARRWQVERRPSDLLGDASFALNAHSGLRKWRAFRGARGGVSLEAFRAALTEIDGRELDALATCSIGDFDLHADGSRLLSLFRQLEHVKPTRTKWTAVSKTMYLLLPDLAVPMDRSTWRFLGRGVPPGLHEEDFRLAYATFSTIARDADMGTALLAELLEPPPGTLRLGLARVVDFALLGWMQDQKG